MPIATTCPNCGASYRLGDPLAGKMVNCPACKNPFRVPAAPAPVPPPAAPATAETPFAIPLPRARQPQTAAPPQPPPPAPPRAVQSRSGPLPPPRPVVVAAPAPQAEAEEPADSGGGGSSAAIREIIITGMIVGGVALGILLLILMMVAMRGGFASTPAPEAVALNQEPPPPVEPIKPPPDRVGIDKVRDPDDKVFLDKKDADDKRFLDKPRDADDKRFLDRKDVDDKRFPDKLRDDKDRFDKRPPEGDKKVIEKPPPKPPPPPPPPVRIALPERPATLPALKPYGGEDRRVCALPGAASQVAVGGAGRYLILHLPKERQLAVFDVSAGQVAKTLPLDEDRVKFAAGADKLLVALSDGRRLERWNLTTFQKEASEGLPEGTEVTGLTMGSASNGPLLFYARQGAQPGHPSYGSLIDIATLKPIELPVTVKLPPNGVFIRASADGRTFGLRDGSGGEPHTCSTVQLRGDKVEVQRKGFLGSVLVPGPDGQSIYTTSGVTDRSLNTLFVNPKAGLRTNPYVPAVHGPYYLQLDPRQPGQLGGGVDVYLEGQQEAFARLDDIKGVTSERISYGQLNDKLPHDQRVIFIPEAKVLVTVPAGENRLILHRFDPEAELAKSGQDYHVVASRPVPSARKGGLYVYPLKVLARAAGRSYRLVSGPAGMRVGPTGRVTWLVPATYDLPEAEATVAVRNTTGREVLHTFRIDVR